MSVVRLDPEGHAEVQALLPWFVTRRLEAAERAAVDAHLGGCARCRAALAAEREWHAALSAPDAPGAVDPGWAAMRRRLAAEAPRVAPRRAARAPWSWRWLAGAQTLAIVLLLAWRVAPPEPTGYRGLGDGAPPAANAVVMFGPDTTEAQIRQALGAAGGRLVGGPTPTHAYLLWLPAADAATLARLRAAPGVTLAASLDAGSGR